MCGGNGFTEVVMLKNGSRKTSARILLPLLLALGLLLSGCKTGILQDPAVNSVPVGRMISLQLQSGFFLGKADENLTITAYEVTNGCLLYADTDEYSHSIRFIAASPGSCEVTLTGGGKSATTVVTVTDNGLEDQVFPYDGESKAFSTEGCGDIGDTNLTVAYYRNGAQIDPALVTDAGIYTVVLTFTNANVPDTDVSLERTLTITENEAWEAYLFSLRRDDPLLKADLLQSVNWTGEELTPAYTTAEGAVVQISCDTDRTAPGVHIVRLFVEEGNGFAGADVTVKMTVDPCVTYLLEGENQQQFFVRYGEAAEPPYVADGPGYTFAGWDTDLSAVTENLIVTAVYNWEYFPITFVMQNMTYTVRLRYGTLPEPPVEKAQQMAPVGTSFAGWDAEIQPATAKATYTAIYG